MNVDISRIRSRLKAFDFQGLFVEELGWEHHPARLPVQVDGRAYTLTAIAEKRGFVAYVCPPGPDGRIPDYPTRRRIDTKVAKLSFEHLLVFVDSQHREQTWQWVRREADRPLACREHGYQIGQPGEALAQKLRGLAVSLEDEENGLLITDVTGKVKSAFNVEHVTKRFYERFKQEHDAFLAFIQGIPDADMARWYASVMLNRLMFIYFIQEKSFLANNPHYLRDHLAASRARGADQFYSGFLCPLFFEGFAKREDQRSAQTNALLGKVPYLNGGIFQRHQVEQLHGHTIRIPDAAFANLLTFFEQYQWHLDERPSRADNEINPDVLGYIFEKYINQKQMGAYYTKEDITGYISQNTVIPYLLDAAHKECAIAFAPGSALWRLLPDEPDKYIYPAVRKGVDQALPDYIEAGIHEVAKRTRWNEPAEGDLALPTEIWRETVARRQRCQELRARLAAGDVHDVNGLITYNLDIRQFAQDAVEGCEGPELLRAFWKALEHVSVLDPTCGSGAFLFAALNILEPLYEACLQRMQGFLDDLERAEPKHHPEKFKDFREVLARVAAHPNQRYFVLKSIILNNLYGVDIMEEAVEICKLRLFLKLVAQVETAERIEPLPDIDFNIKAGNTLVGYATFDEVKKAVTSQFDFDNAMARITEKAEEVDHLFGRFREQQTALGGQVTPEDKAEVRRRLDLLAEELNRHLAFDYGLDVSKRPAYQKWLASHQPFHWFVEFYGIMQSGGFDVIIGNPPYVNLSKVDYQIQGWAQTAECNDLFALVVERAFRVARGAGRLGVIIPLSATSTTTMSPLQNCIWRNSADIWTSYFSASDQPASLFTGVRHRLLILLAKSGIVSKRTLRTTRFLKWFGEERGILFPGLMQYHEGAPSSNPVFAKLSTRLEASIFARVCALPTLAHAVRSCGYMVYYHNAPVHWGKAFDFVPVYRIDGGQVTRSTHLKDIVLGSRRDASAALCILNSSFFYWYNWQQSNCRDLSRRDVLSAPLGAEAILKTSESTLETLAAALMVDYSRNSLVYRRVSSGVVTEFDSFYPARSKRIIDKIDAALAQLYGFTDEELDFIINYDIKYRMGGAAGAAGDGEE